MPGEINEEPWEQLWQERDALIDRFELMFNDRVRDPYEVMDVAARNIAELRHTLIEVRENDRGQFHRVLLQLMNQMDAQKIIRGIYENRLRQITSAFLEIIISRVLEFEAQIDGNRNENIRYAGARIIDYLLPHLIFDIPACQRFDDFFRAENVEPVQLEEFVDDPELMDEFPVPENQQNGQNGDLNEGFLEDMEE